MNPHPHVGPTVHEWANAHLKLVKIDSPNPNEAIYQLIKRMVVNGVEQIQYIWINQHQLRSIGIDHGL